MNLTDEQLDKISTCLCNLATECSFMHDTAYVNSNLIGTYRSSFCQVVASLQAVLRRADKLLDDLHCVEAVLDSLLVKDCIMQDSEV